MPDRPNDIWMRPWTGPNYPKRRLLIVGESAYNGSDGYVVNSETNVEVINGEISGCFPQPTHRKIAEVVSGIDQPDPAEFWNSVAFYNFIQVALTSSTTRPSRGSYLKSRLAFAQLIGLSQEPLLSPRPTHIIAVGVTVTWEEMPSLQLTWRPNLQAYVYPTGELGLATLIRHPASWGHYPTVLMRTRIQTFLALPADKAHVEKLLADGKLKDFS